MALVEVHQGHLKTQGVQHVVDHWDQRRAPMPSLDCEPPKAHPALRTFANSARFLWRFRAKSFNPAAEEKKVTGPNGDPYGGILCPACGLHPDNGEELIKHCPDSSIRATIERANAALKSSPGAKSLASALRSQDPRTNWLVVTDALATLWKVRTRAWRAHRHAVV